MNDVTTLLQRAVEDEPPLGFATADLVARGRRAQRRRTALATAGTAAFVAVLAIAVAAYPSPSATVTTPPAAPSSEHPIPDHLTKDNVAAVLQDQLGIVFRTVTVRERMDMPSGEPALTVRAAVAMPDGRDTVLEFHMAGSLDHKVRHPWTPPTCTDGSDFGNPGNGPAHETYVGTCAAHPLADGAVVVAREGRAPGGFERAAAFLARPDTSSVMVEATNQAPVDPTTCVEDNAGKHCPVGPVVQAHPAVSAADLSALLDALDAATR